MLLTYLKKLNLFSLRRCYACHALSKQPINLCKACYQDLPSLKYGCQQCAFPLPTHTYTHCGACLTTPPPFSHSFALFLYQGIIRHMIVGLKFNAQLIHAHFFSYLLLQAIQQHWYYNHPLPDLILPVPLHEQRLQARGFNQALEIAKPLHSHLNIPLDLSGVRRVKATLAQSTLSGKARIKNVQNAFKSQHDYSNKTIAIVDDVVTTGQTVTALATLLLKKGAKNIHIWACAR